MSKWYETEDTDDDFLSAVGDNPIPFAETGTSRSAIERQVAAVENSKYSKSDGTQQVICIWSGGSAVNAYSLPDWEQIGHWNIEFPEGLDFDGQKEIVKENIDRHMEEQNYPS